MQRALLASQQDISQLDKARKIALEIVAEFDTYETCRRSATPDERFHLTGTAAQRSDYAYFAKNGEFLRDVEYAQRLRPGEVVKWLQSRAGDSPERALIVARNILKAKPDQYPNLTSDKSAWMKTRESIDTFIKVTEGQIKLSKII